MLKGYTKTRGPFMKIHKIKLSTLKVHRTLAYFASGDGKKLYVAFTSPSTALLFIYGLFESKVYRSLTQKTKHFYSSVL